jgi:predicted nucleic acid-binding Zn ribbon protein
MTEVLHKICVSCGYEQPITRFEIVQGTRRRAKCIDCMHPEKIECVYKYPTEEMQKMAQANNRKVHKEIWIYSQTKPIWHCRGCGKEIPRGVATRCDECKGKTKKKKEIIKYNKGKERLSDKYIRRLIRQKFPDLKGQDIPQELIDLQRKSLKIRRDVKRTQQGNSTDTD